CIQGLEYPYSF
nr:immunoglobulin light chain junction region [Macaca mulatta]MOV34243.1 immunoglobulin light chain junction region [Macaca mulatta]MOV34266.1 immunoglobulin light chain junction region [Macaca mulatta]MOV34577.1 immunoglobulin light chain junction region [Macaca mulatta]